MPWQIIPQTVYDLIGRIVPASVLLFLTFAVLRPTPLQEMVGTMSWLKETTTISVVIFSGVATYIVGVVLGQIYSATLGKLLSGRDRVIEKKCIEQCLSEHNSTLEALERQPIHIKVSSLPRTFVMHDHLRLVASSEIPRLLKVRAERRMAQVMMLGAIVLTAVNLVLLVTQFSTYRTYRMILAMTLVLMAIGTWRSSERRLQNVTNGTTIMWLMHATQGPFALPQSSRLTDKSPETTS
jgi:hypothetical protein